MSLERRLDRRADLRLFLGMDALEVGGDGAPKGVRVLHLLDPEDPVELVGPNDLVIGQVPLPTAEIGDPLRVGHQVRRAV